MQDSAVLVIRLWLEGEGAERRVVARLTGYLDVDSEETSSAVVGTIDELTAAVRTWAEAAAGRP